ncbi:MAG TPA: nitrilase-related carbon-nitrogen hydrolase, partial [Anaerolineales bacterium]|nr:nitrilase-related carbon-nitrogen hydrolase [Anaerolineales bacterium]
MTSIEEVIFESLPPRQTRCVQVGAFLISPSTLKIWLHPQIMVIFSNLRHLRKNFDTVYHSNLSTSWGILFSDKRGKIRPMKLNLALAQINTRLGDVESNLVKHLEYIEQAKAEKTDLLVFPELSLTGYVLQDL